MKDNYGKFPCELKCEMPIISQTRIGRSADKHLEGVRSYARLLMQTSPVLLRCQTQSQIYQNSKCSVSNINYLNFYVTL